MSCPSPSPLSPHATLWNETNPNLDALDSIINQHFIDTDCLKRVSLGDGAYSRAFLYTLNSGFQVVAKVILPVRPVFKTEKKTSVSVPDVYLYCSIPNNPVRAEWIIMQYVAGTGFIDCFEDLSAEKRYQTAIDIARIISSIFSITASYCGSVLPDNCENSLRYPTAPLSTRSEAGTQISKLDDIPLRILASQSSRSTVPREQCGPFSSEKEWMEAFLSLNFPHSTEFLSAIRSPDFSKSSVSSSSMNSAGAVTGIIDWEMAGFRPAWLAAVASEWFNDDRRCFATEEGRSLSECSLDNKSFYDQRLRAFFRLQMWKNNELLFRYNWSGKESRRFFGCGCNSKDWWAESRLLVYEERFWKTSRRGPFPFDITTWLLWRMEQQYPSTSTSPTDKPSTPMSPADNP
ncbi:hypothetical protein M422DRAFT_266935 [Sphaerobolus stellatus SS14]|uniref:Unplaced genomic scaffold SPHSTscaffold_168, whole genome shotgun sequence n=1 Tax=Sphaerobolus stellatus (strain SS14) TaxID=990650 RepID=A0A0C9UQQ5_SPHS4|nr:hypothetical protein M422DRAFT_266935 [Sphaerobolus stellatus SS14]